MVRVSGVIGKPTPDIGARLDQRYSEIGARTLEQLIGEQNATGPAAYDDCVSSSGLCHSVAIWH